MRFSFCIFLPHSTGRRMNFRTRLVTDSGFNREFNPQGGDANLLSRHLSPKTVWKWKKLDGVEGAHILSPPPLIGHAILASHFQKQFEWVFPGELTEHFILIKTRKIIRQLYYIWRNCSCSCLRVRMSQIHQNFQHEFLFLFFNEAEMFHVFVLQVVTVGVFV